MEIQQQELRCPLTYTKNDIFIIAEVCLVLLFVCAILFAMIPRRRVPTPVPPPVLPVPPVPPWSSSTLPLFKPLSSKTQVVMVQRTKFYGEYFQTFMILSLGAGSLLCPGNEKQPFTHQDLALVEAWRQISVHPDHVFCPEVGARYYPGCPLSAGKRQHRSTTLHHQSCHDISDILLENYSADQITLAMRSGVDVLDKLVNQDWKQSLETWDSTFVGVFVRKSENRPEGNTTRTELCQVLKKHKSIILVGDDLEKKLPPEILPPKNDHLMKKLPKSGHVVNASQKKMESEGLRVSLSQFLVLRALFKKGVRVLIGKWSGWLLAGLCLGFHIKVIGDLAGGPRARAFLKHFGCVDFVESW
jgi:hypothetical protein